MLNIFKPQILPNFELIELENVCRICLQSTTNMLSLFCNEIDSLISEFLPQKLNQKPLQPHQICAKCFEQAKIAYVFKKQCEYSDGLIKSMLNEPNKSKTCYDKQTQTDGDLILYPCEKCEKKFESSKMLRKHRLRDHHNTPNVCRTCGKVYSTISVLRHHLVSTHPELGFDVLLLCNHKCHLCEAIFPTKLNLKKHLLDVHNTNEYFVTKDAKNGTSEGEGIVERGKYEFSCGNCIETFAVEDDLKNHECTTFPYEKVLEDNSSNGLQLKNNYDKNKIEDASASEENNECYSVFEDNLKTDDEQEEDTLKKNKDGIFTSNIKKESAKLFPEALKVSQKIVGAVTEPKEKIITEVKNVNPKIPHAKPHLCSECGTSFTTSRRLKIHIRTHTGEKPYKCQNCDRAFAAPANLHRHKKTHTGKKDHHCTYCPKSFVQSNELKAHMTTHTNERPYKCSYCPKAFKLGIVLKQHCKRHTGEQGERSYCDLCSLSYSTRNILLNHKRKVHGIDETKEFSCKCCSEKIIGAMAYKKHLNVCHAAPVKPHICSECGASFKNSGNLKAHTRTHSGEKPYKCQYCDRAFAAPANLHRHKKTHTGKKDHHCTYCPKAFTQSNELKVHTRTHTGERPYKCSYCPKAFSDNRTLKKHQGQHTGE